MGHYASEMLCQKCGEIFCECPPIKQPKLKKDLDPNRHVCASGCMYIDRKDCTCYPLAKKKIKNV